MFILKNQEKKENCIQRIFPHSLEELEESRWNRKAVSGVAGCSVTTSSGRRRNLTPGMNRITIRQTYRKNENTNADFDADINANIQRYENFECDNMGYLRADTIQKTHSYTNIKNKM